MKPLVTTNDKLLGLLKKNEAHQDNIDKILDEMQKLETELNKMALQKQKVRDKMKVIVDKIVAKEIGTLEEFEEISSAVRKGEKCHINFINRVELYKEQLRKANEPTTVPTTETDDTDGKTK